MRKIIITLMIIAIPYLAMAKTIWIYADDGTWQDGIVALEKFLDFIGEKHDRVFAKDLNLANDYSDAKAICFPGGFSYNYKVKLSNNTIDNIRNYVAKGGSYIGICAGAYFAATSVVWEGIEYDYSLGLFKGKAVGSIQEIAPWDNYSMTTISILEENPILTKLKPKWNVLYYGGPHFESFETNFDIIASWDNYKGYPAIINFNFEKGKVLLIGPHLEIEENSGRDSTNFAEELDDVESDWEFLEIMVKWVLPTASAIKTSDKNSSNSNITPNPASEYIEINFSGIKRLSHKSASIYKFIKYR